MNHKLRISKQGWYINCGFEITSYAIDTIICKDIKYGYKVVIKFITGKPIHIYFVYKEEALLYMNKLIALNNYKDIELDVTAFSTKRELKKYIKNGLAEDLAKEIL